MNNYYAMQIREPDPHHYHWGIEFSLQSEDETFCLNRAIENEAKVRSWNPFHQGGSNNRNGWQYWEFWGLYGAEDHRWVVEQFILIVREKSQKMYQEWYGEEVVQ